MTYAIGDQVEDYVLTEQGWVPQLDLDTSPFRPGHVVNGAILTGTLEWQPLRTAPVVPYRVGDVVEGYVLVPSGDWVPLADQVREPSGSARRATAVPAEPAAEARRTASVRTTQTQARPQTQPAQARPQAQPTARQATARPQTQPRPQAQPQPQVQPRPQQASRPGAQVQYRVGQVVNGHVLTADRGWVPLPRPQVQRGTGRPAPQPARKNNDVTGRALLGAIAVVVFVLVRSCS